MKKMVIFGYGQRGCTYASFSMKFPEKFELVAIIETDEKRVEMAKTKHPNVKIFVDYKDFLKEKIQADILVVSTQDAQHREHAVAMMEAGYDLLLEKPVASTVEDCLAIYECAKRLNRKVIVCHVLRYTPFYRAVKNIIKSGKLGEVVTIHASENVGWYHQAHSFVRGPWRNKSESSPMILAKCCHDMDILRYLMDEKCESISSYGDLFYFNESHAPKGSAKYCSECKVDCIYRAQDIYTEQNSKGFASYFLAGELSNERILKALKGTIYDKCVFKTDNDVVDHQVTIARFSKGKTVCHTMTAFSKTIYRDIKIHGTKGELVGKVEENELEFRPFNGEVEKISPDLSSVVMGGHAGGDYYLMEDLYKLLCGEETEHITYLDVSIESHLMCFAAEKSRISGGIPINI